MVAIKGCANNNQVQRIEATDSIIKYKDNNDDGHQRFANLYPGKKSYPVTCSENCYPITNELLCQTDSPADNCQFEGEQVVPTIDSGFTIQWLGHASFYIQSPDGSSFLIDPVSQQFDWPVNWAFRIDSGFNRNEPNWLSTAQEQQLDAILYSHIHYDHFNKSDIERIGNSPTYFVPLNFADHFPNDEYRINEMAWYASEKVNEVTLHFVPAHHFSSRIWVPKLYEDNDKTLWGGWVLEHKGKRIFYAGDTGYSQHFKDIQKQYGDMDVCLIPIASYFHSEQGDWYRYVHTTPEDALVAADELNCKVMIPWGYGNASWKMGDLSSHSALQRLLHMVKQLDTKTPLYILNEGEQVQF
ncbi:hypothetical protein GCM10009114_11010 [Aliiglaciecola litoralis]|uniref:Metallo-beta-lactamase domain-containing protein n=1 Tax=Aliiglaciecola litoralis TaxID=582857 RepID=A0ABP3WPE2_9ALTE